MINNKEAIEFDILCGKLFSMFLIINSINILAKTIWNGTFITNYLTIILGFTFIFVYMRSGKVFYYTLAKIVIIELILTVIVTSSIIRYPEVSAAIEKRCLWLFVFGVPFIIIGRYIKNPSIFIEQTIKASFIVNIFGIIMFIYAQRSASKDVYSMTMSYMMLYPTLVHIIQMIKKKIYVIPLLVELLVIILYGSRGALICISAFVVLFFFLSKINSYKVVIIKIGIIIVVAIIVFLVYINAESILTYIGLKGIYSRTLSLLLSGNVISHDSGRLFIYNMIYEKIMDKPLTGWGIAGQVSFMNTYSHNIFLDLLLEYGIPIGSIISLLIVVLPIRIVFKDIDNCKYYLALICAGLLPLLVSGTYIQEPIFWLTMGISLPAKEYSRLRIKSRKKLS